MTRLPAEDDNSITGWIEKLSIGDEQAAQRIWCRFSERLLTVAAEKLRHVPRRVANEEDVVISVFDTLFRRVRQGRFPALKDREDLWRLLVTITERKAISLMRQQGRRKRGEGRVAGESFFTTDEAAPNGLDMVSSPEPTPELAAMFTESIAHLFSLLNDELKMLALLRFEGYSNQEIAVRTGKSVPTVERRIKLIREYWKDWADTL